MPFLLLLNASCVFSQWPISNIWRRLLDSGYHCWHLFQSHVPTEVLLLSNFLSLHGSCLDLTKYLQLKNAIILSSAESLTFFLCCLTWWLIFSMSFFFLFQLIYFSFMLSNYVCLKPTYFLSSCLLSSRIDTCIYFSTLNSRQLISVTRSGKV